MTPLGLQSVLEGEHIAHKHTQLLHVIIIQRLKSCAICNYKGVFLKDSLQVAQVANLHFLQLPNDITKTGKIVESKSYFNFVKHEISSQWERLP